MYTKRKEKSIWILAGPTGQTTNVLFLLWSKTIVDVKYQLWAAESGDGDMVKFLLAHTLALKKNILSTINSLDASSFKWTRCILVHA